MFEWVKSQPTSSLRGVITKLFSHPGMRKLMKSEGNNQSEDSGYEGSHCEV